MGIKGKKILFTGECNFISQRLGEFLVRNEAIIQSHHDTPEQVSFLACYPTTWLTKEELAPAMENVDLVVHFGPSCPKSEGNAESIRKWEQMRSLHKGQQKLVTITSLHTDFSEFVRMNSQDEGAHLYLHCPYFADTLGGWLSAFTFPIAQGFDLPSGLKSKKLFWACLENSLDPIVDALGNDQSLGHIYLPGVTSDVSEIASVLQKTLSKSSLLPSFLLPFSGNRRMASYLDHNVNAEQVETNRDNLTEVLTEKLGKHEYNSSHFLHRRQWVPFQLEHVWEFFSSEKNLERITPDLLRFKVKRMSTDEIQLGSLIDYTLRLHGIPMGWKTEITAWEPKHKFVDFQLKGPYKVWHHTHTFESFAGGTLVDDLVRFIMPMGALSSPAAAWVFSDVTKIFQYRLETINTAMSES